ncbi:hypothetical protein HaLaN_28232 [Haematococcus lacustris]|uniref:Uncharacterized protein n=1 Tax=Haematococcus lacustris TaxID=44745 RepID=A0A6A0A9X5_HAELA|nr:hypothetical protein HaLaN_28232 [Haematococcus lacustris]
MRPSAQAPQVHCNRVSQNCLPAVAVTISTGQQLPSAAAADTLCCHDAVRVAARHGAWLGQSWTNLLPAFGGGVEGPYNQRRALAHIYGRNFGKALEIVDQGLVACLQGEQSGRQIFQASATPSRQGVQAPTGCSGELEFAALPGAGGQ